MNLLLRGTNSYSLLILLFCFISRAANGAIDTFEFASAEQAQLFHELTKQLRCPKCQNQNISDSNAQLAKDLRNKTYQLVKQGKSEEQVVDYMVARFGNFVRYDPPMTAATIFLWLGPLLFILLGFYFLYSQISRHNKQNESLNRQEAKRLHIILGKTKSDENDRQLGGKQ